MQIAKQVVSLNPLELRLPSRAWKVKLVGEGADDAGGVFDDTITEMCQVGGAAANAAKVNVNPRHFIFGFFEFNSFPIVFRFCRQELQSGVVDLLIHTPNSFADVGCNTDRCPIFLCRI